jgi:hypothetical protein
MEIPGEAELLRHIHPEQWLAKEQRPSSAAFKGQFRLSVNWKAIWGVEQTRRPNSAAVVKLIAGPCRNLGQLVEHTPLSAEEPFGPNPSHVDIVGEKPRPVARQLANLATPEWINNSGGDS